MLIQFSARNFKSFKDIFTLDLFTKKQDAVSVIYTEADTNIYPSAVFYGANGSGKSNILKAFAMMRRLVLNEDKIIQSTDALPVNQFRLSSESEDDTTSFDICFVFEGKKFKYGFEYDTTCVYSEYLYIYESVRRTIVFEYDLAENNGKIKAPQYKDLQNLKHLKNSLFLVEADRNDNATAKQVLQWFKSCRFIEYSSRMPLNSTYWNNLSKPEIKVLFQSFITSADFGIKDIFQEVKFGNNNVEEVTVKTLHPKYDENNNPVSDVPFNLFDDESLGTQKYFHVIGPVIDALQDGSVLFLDELDASLHPILTRRIVELFNNKASNKKGAQLIFTSQDTNLLDQLLFDKEQIWFTEKDKYGCSHLISLAEYKDVRKEHKIEKNYIMGKYGAIPYLGDFNF